METETETEIEIETKIQNCLLKQIQLNERVKTSQLSEEELLKILHVADLETIVRYQKLSDQSINRLIIPLLCDKDNQHISLKSIYRWQQYIKK